MKGRWKQSSNPKDRDLYSYEVATDLGLPVSVWTGEMPCKEAMDNGRTINPAAVTKEQKTTEEAVRREGL